MLAFARIDLGFTGGAFFRLTPRQFGFLARRVRAARQRSDQMVEMMIAQLIAMVANTGFRSYEEPRQPKEFMPSEWAKQPAPEKPKRLTQKRRMEIAAETKRILRGK